MMDQQKIKRIETLEANINVLRRCVLPFILVNLEDRSKLIKFYSENQSSYLMVLMMINSISIDLKNGFKGSLETLLRFQNIQSQIWKLRIEFMNFIDSALSTGGTSEKRTEIESLINQISAGISSLKNNQIEGLSNDN